MIESTNRKLVVLAACLLPALSLADAPPADAPGAAPAAAAAPAAPPAAPPAEARPLPRWSFGGGVGIGLFNSTSGSLGGLFSSTSGSLVGLGVSQVPSIGTSLERRLSPRSWAVLGVSGAMSRHRGDVPDGSAGLSRDDYRQVTVSAGLRRTLTRASAPVGVSLIVLAQGGIFDGERRYENRFPGSPSTQRADATAWFAGAELGIAIDRELTEGLSVRVASPLVDVRYGRGSNRVAGRPDVGTSDFFAGVSLAPRLELRLLF